MSAATSLDRIGVGIDTARYGHRVCFLRPDRSVAAPPLTVRENRASYRALQERLEQLHQRHPQAHFHVRIDAAGQYAANLEAFLRSLPLPMTLSIGEPKRNKDYQKAHFPKRTTDDTESQAMARFAVVEQPPTTAAVPAALTVLREVVARLQAKVKQSTQAINRMHNLLARVFPELALLTEDLTAGWVLHLLDKYPTAQRIAQTRLVHLHKIPYVAPELMEQVHLSARQSVASLHGAVAETLVRDLVEQVRHTQRAEQHLRDLLAEAFDALPKGAHDQVLTIPGIGKATAAVLIAKIVDIDRFATAAHLVGYFGSFPEEERSGVDKYGNPLPPGTLRMSRKGHDLARHYLWNAARCGIVHNPALRALYRRLKSKGTRGDVALGHCMRKLLQLVFAVWKTNRPFDPEHFAWEKATPTATAAGARTAGRETAVGHTRDLPAEEVVTTATSTVAPTPRSVNPGSSSSGTRGVPVDFAYLRQQVSMEQVLRELGLLERLRGRGQQRRGSCPIHGHTTGSGNTFSVHLGKNVFQCFHADCGAQGNVLDLWAAVKGLALRPAALDLAATFGLAPNREEEPVGGTR
jgi:transposase